MIESSFNLSEIKSALKRKDLTSKRYKLQNKNSDNESPGYLTFLDTANGTKLSGKIVSSSNERDYWPFLNHDNIAPLFDVLNIRNDLIIYLTINIQVKLKDIIHKEDFLRNSRCFNRKKAYAKDIFSGLNYLHGSSLCMMNLSDDNIYIYHDKAVLFNFSFVSRSRKITRHELKVSELYKAPETEKQEFDPIAAEMWAAGTLMLDLFLAHIVPWAIIDYKPQRVLEMVNKLSLELLQAANAGSIIKETDLVKFKTFLKCFFKESQSRITAKYASIASFLSTDLLNEELSMVEVKPICNSVPQQTETECSTSEEDILQSVISSTDINLNHYYSGENCYDSKTEECFDYNGSSEEVCLDSETLNYLKSNLTGSSDSNCTERDENFSTRKPPPNLHSEHFNEDKGTIKTEININTNSIKNACNMQIGSNEKPYHDSKDKTDSFSSSKIFLNKTSKSYQMITKKTNEFGLKHYQSKSLPLINHCDKTNSENVVKERSDKIYLGPSVRSLAIESDLNKGDYCLNHLFENNEWREKATTEKKVSYEVLNTVQTKDFTGTEGFIKYKPKYREISPREVFESGKEIKLLSRDISPHLNDKMSIQWIKKRFENIRKAEISLKDLNLLFVSEEMADKQRNSINEYRDLLREQKIRLCEVLCHEYKLSRTEVKKLLKSIGQNSRYTKNNKISIPSNLQYSSSEFSDSTLGDMRENENISPTAINNSRQKLRDSKNKLKSRKRPSYYKDIETPANQIYKNRDYGLKSVMPRKNSEKSNATQKDFEKNKLILMENKAPPLKVNGGKTEIRKTIGARESHITKNPSFRRNSSFEVFVYEDLRNISKELLIPRKEKKTGETNETKTRRKWLCCCIC